MKTGSKLNPLCATSSSTIGEFPSPPLCLFKRGDGVSTMGEAMHRSFDASSISDCMKN